jgi:nitroreductase
VEFQEVVRRRRMVRSFDPSPLDDEVVERMLENALHAPSAGFSQAWGFLVLTEPDDRAQFWSVASPEGGPAGPRWTGIADAPVIIVPLSNKSAYLERYAQPDKGWTDRDEQRWPVPYWDIDTGFAALLMLLTAVDQGLGALFFGIPPDRIPPFRSAFGVPDDHTPIGAIAVGRRVPDTPSPSLRRGRRPVEEVVHRGRW